MSSVAVLSNFPLSADSAQTTIDVQYQPKRRKVDRDTELLLECIAAAYRLYHQSDSVWTRTRRGERRLRLIGKFGTETAPRGSYISVDLEDFQ